MDPPYAELCAACTKLVQQISVKNPQASPELSLSDLCASASSCSLCYLTKQAFHDAGYEKDLEACDEESHRLRRARSVHFWVRSADVKDAVHFQDDDVPGICIMEIKYNRNSHDYDCFIFEGFERYVRFSAEPGSPAAASRKVYAGPTIASSGSPESFAHINTLLTGCIAHHAECRKTLGGTAIDDDQSQPPNLPAHILDLGDPDSDHSPSSSLIRLAETQPGQRGHYAALSYCWGASPSHHPPTTITTAGGGIPLASLPQTFQDAVTATRALGLRFLWIDALCIPQNSNSNNNNSQADFRRNIGPVYSLARLVLAASAAASPADGLFRPYPTRVAVTLPYLDASGRSAGGMRAELRPHERVLSPESKEGSPLSQRAWAAVEHALARRVAHFTAGAVVWKCRRWARRALWDDGVLYYAAGMTGAGTTDWPRFVGEYSAGEMAVKGDRLVALEGVVGELAAVRGGGVEAVECVYGLWTDALATHLMWSRIGAPGSMSRPEELTAVAPTWSWASTEGGVNVMSEERFRDDGPEVRAELAIDDANKRRIGVKGKLGRVELRIIEKPDPYLHPCDCEVRSEEGDFVGLAATDVGLGEGVKTATVFCLVVMFHPHNFQGGSYLTLFLQPREDASDHYIRIGNGMITKKEWADQLMESELYLV